MVNLDAFLALFKRDRTASFTALMKEMNAMKEEYKADAKQLRQELETVHVNEQLCLIKYTNLEQKYRDLREKVIFLEGKKPLS